MKLAHSLTHIDAGMAFPYIPLLILFGFIGIHSEVTTVTKVSVKAGGSISIPCLYGPSYRNHVKYLCKGFYWISCSDAVKTNQPNKEKFSISDDTSHRIFNVTINNLTGEDSDYWCAVEIDHKLDIKAYFHLNVSAGLPGLYVDQQEITAFEGGSVTVSCHYHYSGEKKWCRLGSSCVDVKEQSGYIDETRVTINASVPNVFIVTMSELRLDSSSWYLCAKGDLQMPVHITVTEQTPTTTTTMSTATIMSAEPSTAQPTNSTAQTTNSIAQPTNSIAQPTNSIAQPTNSTAQPTNSTTAGAGGDNLQEEHQSSIDLKHLILPLSFLVLVIIAALFGWRMIKHKKGKAETSDITVDPQTGSDPEVLYITVVPKLRRTPQKNQTADEGVIYSDIVTKNRTQQKTEPAEGSVTYSVVGPH